MDSIISSIGNINIQDFPVTTKIIPDICINLPENYWKIIGEGLGIRRNILEEIDQGGNNYDDYEKLCKVLYNYQKIQKDEAWPKYSVFAPLLPIECRDEFEKKLMSHEELKEVIVLETALAEIKHMLKITYNNLQLPNVSAWCKEKELYFSDLYVDLMLYTKNNDGIDVAKGQIQLEDIFKPIGEFSQATRILIEGQPGYGKTTFGYKLLFDWARGKEYMSQFQLVFNIPLRYFDGDIEAALIENCNVDKLTDEHKRQIIENYTEEILVILDGLDEIDDEKKNTLVTLLNGTLFSNMTIIVTSRTGLFYTVQQKSKQRKICTVKAMKTQNQIGGNFFQKKIEIVGLLPRSQALFLEKYFPTERENVENWFLNSDEVISDLCQCPLYLFLLAVLMEDGILVAIETKTDLYEKIFAYIIKRTLCKEEMIDECETLDLFQGPINELLTQFGGFALENLKIDKLCFDQEQILQYCNEIILKVGFLFKHVNFAKHQRQESYQPIHKSFLEFAAAYYLWTKIKDVPESEINNYDVIIKLVESGFGPTEESIVYPFLAGLLHENAKIFFLALSPYGVFYPVNGYIFPEILTEIKMTEEIFKSLQKFVPCLWENHNYPDFFNSSRHADILNRAILAKYIKLLCWNLHYPCQFPSNVKIDTLHMIVVSDCSNGLITSKETSINCRHLIISVNKVNLKAWKQLLLVLSKLKMRQVTVRIMEFFNRKMMLTSLRKSALKNKQTNSPQKVSMSKLHKLFVCQLAQHEDGKLMNHIKELVVSGLIKYGLSLRISKKGTSTIGFPIGEEHVNNLIDALSKSSLKEFCVVVDKNSTLKPTVELCDFCNHEWDKLVLKGSIIVTCSLLPPKVNCLVVAFGESASRLPKKILANAPIF